MQHIKLNITVSIMHLFLCLETKLWYFIGTCKKWQVLKTLTKKIISSKILGLKAFSKPPSPMNAPWMPYIVHITNKYPRVTISPIFGSIYFGRQFARIVKIRGFGGVWRCSEEFSEVLRCFEKNSLWTDGLTNRRTDKPTDQQTDRLTDRQTNWWTNPHKEMRGHI